MCQGKSSSGKSALLQQRHPVQAMVCLSPLQSEEPVGLDAWHFMVSSSLLLSQQDGFFITKLFDLL